MFPLNSDMCGIPYVLTHDPAYAGAVWNHGYEPDQPFGTFNYAGLNWLSEEVDKPTEEELFEKWNTTYKALWQASGPGSPWTELRRNRDILLAETDWSQLEDVNAETKATYATYRQALRDLPANTVDPENPVYPTKP